MARVVLLIPIVVAFGLIPFAFAALRRFYKGREALLIADVSNSEKTADILKANRERLEGKLIELDKEVSDIAGLYEITKAMSMSLLFSEIFKTFSEFLRRNFRFIGCRLILTGRGEDRNKQEKVYDIKAASNGKRPVSRQGLIDTAVLDKVYKTKEAAHGEDFIAVPLMSRNKILGILVVEGLREEALDKFLIVARQFSLEIEKAELYETVQELAITDGLTDVFVRRHFLERLREEFERSLKHEFKLSFLMIDLDYFKKCNDAFGHLVGDAVLQEVARVLKQSTREIDLVARYGGEEFSLLLPETDKASAAAVAERLRVAVLSQGFNVYDEVIKTSISVGVSTFPDDARGVEELIESADKALYKAKADGRNRVAVFTRG